MVKELVTLKRTTSEDPDFREMVSMLDAYLAFCDGKDAPFYAQYNKIDSIRYVIVAFFNDVPAGCGAIKHFEDDTMEVKRMYVKPEFRKKGVARAILAGLENWTSELGYTNCILETGKRQLEAIALYQSCNYKVIPNYGQYADVVTSVCMKKQVLKS
jgi:GNAT superfamily N-acetyltransferase